MDSLIRLIGLLLVLGFGPSFGLGSESARLQAAYNQCVIAMYAMNRTHLNQCDFESLTDGLLVALGDCNMKLFEQKLRGGDSNYDLREVARNSRPLSDGALVALSRSLNTQARNCGDESTRIQIWRDERGHFHGTRTTIQIK